MKIDSHENVKVNISKLENKFNDVKHPKENVTYQKKKKYAYKKVAPHFSKAVHFLGRNEKHLKRFLGTFFFWVRYMHHQLTVNVILPKVKIPENETSNKTSLGKLPEDLWQ